MKAYTLGIYEKALPAALSWKEKLYAAQEAGYDFLEISIDETDEKLARLDMSREERMDLLCTSRELCVPIRTMCLSGHRKYPIGSSCVQTEKKGMEIMEKAIRLAEDLGIAIIQLAGYDVYYEEGDENTRMRFERNLKKAVEMAAGRSVILAFETMETEFMNTVEKAMHYVSLLHSPYLHVYPDIGNITNAAVTYGGSVLDDLETGKRHLCAMHLKETVPGKFREIPYGTGHVDFESAIKKAWELGVRKYTTEFWHVGSPEWKKDLDFAVRMMRKILDGMSDDNSGMEGLAE